MRWRNREEDRQGDREGIRERREREENLEMRVGILELEKDRLGNGIAMCISSFEAKVLLIESNIKALRAEFFLHDTTN